MLKPFPPAFTQYVSSQTAPSTTPGTTITASGSTNTKGNWTQLVASLGFDAQLIIINAANSAVAATDTSTLLDIGIGASSSESVLIPDLLVGWTPVTDAAGSPRHYIFPLYVPSGSRISARCASARVSNTVAVWITAYGGLRRSEDWWCGEQVLAYGINSGVSQGTNITPGVSGAEGSWTSVGTTSQDHSMIVPGVGMNDTNAAANIGVTFDFGIDTTSTYLFRENYRASYDASERISQFGIWWPVNVPVASGSVLAARASMAGGAADTLDLAFYGIS